MRRAFAVVDQQNAGLLSPAQVNSYMCHNKFEYGVPAMSSISGECFVTFAFNSPFQVSIYHFNIQKFCIFIFLQIRSLF